MRRKLSEALFRKVTCFRKGHFGFSMVSTAKRNTWEECWRDQSKKLTQLRILVPWVWVVSEERIERHHTSDIGNRVISGLRVMMVSLILNILN